MTETVTETVTETAIVTLIIVIVTLIIAIGTETGNEIEIESGNANEKENGSVKETATAVIETAKDLLLVDHLTAVTGTSGHRIVQINKSHPRVVTQNPAILAPVRVHLRAVDQVGLAPVRAVRPQIAAGAVALRQARLADQQEVNQESQIREQMLQIMIKNESQRIRRKEATSAVLPSLGVDVNYLASRSK